MSTRLEITSVAQLHRLGGLAAPQHQLVSVVHNRDIQSVAGMQGIKVVSDLYMIIFKSSSVCDGFTYGRSSYDHQQGTLVFTGPGQAMEFTSDTTDAGDIDPDGWTLVFHPDLLLKSTLGEKINQYSFFHYDSNEALHLSEQERTSIEGLLEKVEQEYGQSLDRHSHKLIVSNVELFLDYCLRFYDRQFFSRTTMNSDTVSRFEKLLITHFESGEVARKGLPSVEQCAKELAYSPNYLSDLLKKETGKTALEHIHFFLIEKAKHHLLNSSDSISGIAYTLGFEYPQRFSNLFRAKTGMSPSEYRHVN